MHKRFVIAAILFCLLVRGGFLLVAPEPFEKDIDAYRAIAVCLRETGCFGLQPVTQPEIIDQHVGVDAAENPAASTEVAKPTAFRPPLYPAVLSLLVKDGALPVLAMACLHLTMALITVVAVFLAMKTVTDDDRLSLVAALLVSADPILLQQSTLVMTETLAAMLAALVILLWSRLSSHESELTLTRSLVIGVVLGLAFLCRPTFLVWAGLLTLACWVFQAWEANAEGRLIWKRLFVGKSLIKPMAMGLPVLLILAAWTSRNQLVLGAPVWATTHGGYTILLANNESFYDYVDANPLQAVLGPPWDAEPFLEAYQHRFVGDMRTAKFWETDWRQFPVEMPPLIDEVADDESCNQAAKATIGRRPYTFVTSSAVRVARLWSPLPLRRPAGFSIKIAGVTIWYLVVYALVLIAIARHRKALLHRQWIAIWLLCFTLTAVHAIYWSNLRMRGPAMPGLCMVACLAFLPARREENSQRSSGDETSSA